MFKFVMLAASALFVVSSNAGSVCADAQPAVLLPPAPYCPPFAVSAAQQRLIFDRFVEGSFISGNFVQTLMDHVSDDFIQHNPDLLSGKAAILSANLSLTDSDVIIITQAFDENTQIGMVHHYSKPAPGTQPRVVADIFRMNGSCVVEHWDVIQSRPENATNPIAMF